jgi:hypothetical protein
MKGWRKKEEEGNQEDKVKMRDFKFSRRRV